jgi:sulfatase maturation enzyme AslB (radical SAM superfamily)
MPWRVLRTAIDHMLAGADGERSLQFTGGEPLLAFLLIKKAVAYVEKHTRDGRGVTYDISTNGTLMSRPQLAFLADKKFKLQLSFDGVAAAQAVRGKGTFARLDSLLDLIRQEATQLFRHDFRVAVTVNREALSVLADSVDYLVGKQVREISLAPDLRPSIKWTSSDSKMLERQFDRIFASSLRRYQDTGDVPLLLFRKDHSKPRRVSHRGPICGAAAGRRITVDVDGQVYACPMLAESFQVFPDTPLRQRLMAMRLGDMRDPGLDARIRALPKAAEKAEIFSCKESKYSSLGRCADCRFIDECTVCPVPVARDPKCADPNRVPDHLCAYNQISLSYRARFPRQVSPLDVITGRASFASFIDPLGRLGTF